MADHENQNLADGEVVDTEPAQGQSGEVDEQNTPADHSNNQGEEQTEEAATEEGQTADKEQTQEDSTVDKEKTQEDSTLDKEQTQEDQTLDNEESQGDKTVDNEQTQEDQIVDKEKIQEDEIADKEKTQEDISQNAVGDVEEEKVDEVKAEDENTIQASSDAANEGDTNDNQNAETEQTEVQQDDKTEVVDEAQGQAEQEAGKDENEENPEEKPVAAEEPPTANNEQAEEGERATDDTEQVTTDPVQPAGDHAQAPIDEEAVDSTQVNNDMNQNATEDGEKQEANVQQDEVQIEQGQEGMQEGEPEPVQVESDVKEGPPTSPKVAIEEKKLLHVNLEATATVKFVLMPSGQVVTLACTLGQTLESLKSHFAVELKMSSALIMIMFDGKNMPDSTTLADLGVGPNGTVQLEMQSADPVNTPLKPYRPRQEYHMPDVITVRVMTEDGEAKDVVVEIERSRFKKPFLGGFRNKNSGIEYHNAAAQTMKKPRPPPTVERFCRDTQTCEQKNTRQQTTNTTSTQMTGIGVYISNMEDKLLTPGKYFSAGEHWDMILRNVIILQKYYRRWLAKRYVNKLKEDKAKRLEWERQEELRKKREKEERIKRDYARRLNPKTKADFDMLLHCLEKWRQEEMERINSTLTGAERKAALCMLLDQETELLSAIERHKNEANKDNRDNRIIAFLEKAAAPKKWQGHDGKLTYMDTPFTIRAKELRDIYNSINMKYLTQDERLDVLLTLKHTVKEHDCKLTQEIIELIDREADLLMRGVKEGNLTGLRKRISTLFLQYIKTPTFNPEAARLLKVPQDPSTLRKDINYCHSCGRYLPSTDFFITSNSKHVGRCRNCMKIENDGRQREDYTFYRVMLKSLRKSEEAMQDGSSICYLLQENDLRYLVENIWNNQSVLSAWDDLYDLVLVRWDKHQEWSPWNCILLTHDEAEAHQKLFSLEEGYGQVFIHKVTQKHNFARNYFSRLPGMAELLRQKVGNRDLVNNNNGPTVSGHTVPKAQKV